MKKKVGAIAVFVLLCLALAALMGAAVFPLIGLSREETGGGEDLSRIAAEERIEVFHGDNFRIDPVFFNSDGEEEARTFEYTVHSDGAIVDKGDGLFAAVGLSDEEQSVVVTEPISGKSTEVKIDILNDLSGIISVTCDGAEAIPFGGEAAFVIKTYPEGSRFTASEFSYSVTDRQGTPVEGVFGSAVISESGEVKVTLKATGLGEGTVELRFDNDARGLHASTSLPFAIGAGDSRLTSALLAAAGSEDGGLAGKAALNGVTRIEVNDVSASLDLNSLAVLQQAGNIPSLHDIILSDPAHVLPAQYAPETFAYYIDEALLSEYYRLWTPSGWKYGDSAVNKFLLVLPKQALDGDCYVLHYDYLSDHTSNLGCWDTTDGVLPTPEDDANGYLFEKWLSADGSDMAVHGKGHLFASWGRGRYLLLLNAVIPTAQLEERSVELGQDAALAPLPVPDAATWNFDRWYLSDGTPFPEEGTFRYADYSQYMDADKQLTVYAAWTGTLSLSDGLRGTDEDFPVKYGETPAYPTADDKDGWQFKGWTSDASLGTLLEGSYTGDGDATVYARYEGSVTLRDDFSESLMPATVVYDAVPNFSAPAANDRGYTFAGWSPDEAARSPVADGKPYTGAANATLYSRYEGEITFTDARDPRDSEEKDQHIPVIYGLVPEQSVAAPDDGDGWEFKGWRTDISNNRTEYAPISPYKGDGDAVYQARWTGKVTLKDEFGSDSSGDVIYGQAPKLPTPSGNNGWTFDAWTSDAELTSPVDGEAYTGRGDATLFSRYTGTFTLVRTEQDRRTITVVYGLKPVLPVPELSEEWESGGWAFGEWEFVGWMTNTDRAIPFNSDAAYKGSGEGTLYAKWKTTVTFRDTLNGDKSDSIEMFYAVMPSRTPVEPTITHGWSFSGWRSELGDPYTQFDANVRYVGEANAVYFACWKGKLTLSDGLAVGEATSLDVVYDAVPELPVRGNASGWQFKGWTFDPAFGTPFEAVPYKGENDKTIYARYEGSLTLFDEFADATQPFPLVRGMAPSDLPEGIGQPETGWQFKNWSPDNARTSVLSVSQPYVGRGDATLYSVYGGTLTLSDARSGNTTAVEVIHGIKIVADKVPTPEDSDGWTFDAWCLDPTKGNSDLPLNEAYMGDGNATYVPRWKGTLTLSDGLNGGGEIKLDVLYGIQPALPDRSDANGWVFKGWASNEASESILEGNYTGAGDATVYARYEGTLTLHDALQETDTPHPVVYGLLPALPDRGTVTGWHFSQWQLSEGNSVSEQPYTGAGDATLSARYTASVSLEYNGGTAEEDPSAATLQVVFGLSPVEAGASLPEPTLTNWRFVGWYTEDATLDCDRYEDITAFTVKDVSAFKLYAAYASTLTLATDGVAGEFSKKSIEVPVILNAMLSLAPYDGLTEDSENSFAQAGYYFSEWKDQAGHTISKLAKVEQAFGGQIFSPQYRAVKVNLSFIRRADGAVEGNALYEEAMRSLKEEVLTTYLKPEHIKGYSGCKGWQIGEKNFETAGDLIGLLQDPTLFPALNNSNVYFKDESFEEGEDIVVSLEVRAIFKPIAFSIVYTRVSGGAEIYSEQYSYAELEAGTKKALLLNADGIFALGDAFNDLKQQEGKVVISWNLEPEATWGIPASEYAFGENITELLLQTIATDEGTEDIIVRFNATVAEIKVTLTIVEEKESGTDKMERKLEYRGLTELKEVRDKSIANLFGAEHWKYDDYKGHIFAGWKMTYLEKSTGDERVVYDSTTSDDFEIFYDDSVKIIDELLSQQSEDPALKKYLVADGINTFWNINITLTAEWRLQTFSITYDPAFDGAESRVESIGYGNEYAALDASSEHMPIYAGHYFMGWKCEELSEERIVSGQQLQALLAKYAEAENHRNAELPLTFTAQWGEKHIIVKEQGRADDGYDPYTPKVSEETPYSELNEYLLDVPKDCKGFIFHAWLLDDASFPVSADWPLDVSADIKAYADSRDHLLDPVVTVTFITDWTQKTVTVSYFDVLDGAQSEADPAQKNLKYHDIESGFVLTVLERENCFFLNWEFTADLTAFYPLNGDHLRYTEKDGRKNRTGTENEDIGTALLRALEGSSAVEHAFTLKAYFETQHFDVTVDPDGAIPADGSELTAAYTWTSEDTYELLRLTRAGYGFMGWRIDLSDDEVLHTATLLGNGTEVVAELVRLRTHNHDRFPVTLAAVWEEKQLSFTFEHDIGVGYTEDRQTLGYTAVTQEVFKTRYQSGWAFKEWKLFDNSTGYGVKDPALRQEVLSYADTFAYYAYNCELGGAAGDRAKYDAAGTIPISLRGIWEKGGITFKIDAGFEGGSEQSQTLDAQKLGGAQSGIIADPANAPARKGYHFLGWALTLTDDAAEPIQCPCGTCKGESDCDCADEACICGDLKLYANGTAFFNTVRTIYGKLTRNIIVTVTGQWEAVKYTVTLNDGGELEPLTGDYESLSAAAVLLPNPVPRAKDAFTGWKSGEGAILPPKDEVARNITDTLIKAIEDAGDVASITLTYTATWTEKRIEVVLDYNDPTRPQQTLVENSFSEFLSDETTYTLPDIGTRTGYFSENSWEWNRKQYQQKTEALGSQDAEGSVKYYVANNTVLFDKTIVITFVAVRTEQKVTIHYKGDSGEQAAEDSELNFSQLDSWTFPKLDEGYFVFWHTADDTKTEYEGDKNGAAYIKSKMDTTHREFEFTFIARMQEIVINVKYQDLRNETLDGSFRYSEAYTLQTATKEKGKYLEKWTWNEGKTAYTRDMFGSEEVLTALRNYAYKTYRPEVDVTFSPNWLTKTIKVVFQDSGTKSSGAKTATVSYDASSYSLPTANSYEGYSFNWENGSKLYNAGNDVIKVLHDAETGDSTQYTVTFTAVYSGIQFTIHFHENTGSRGNTPPDDMAVTFDDGDEKITLPGQGSLSKKDYAFQGWHQIQQGMLSKDDALPSGTMSGGNKISDVALSGGKFVPQADANGKYSMTLYAVWKSTVCFTGRTMITLADGTEKPIEEVQTGDLVLSWNFYTGQLQAVPVIALWYHGSSVREIIHLMFDNGKTVEIIGEHDFFDFTTNDFVAIDASTGRELIGHEFAALGEDGCSRTRLKAVYMTHEYTGVYSILTAFNYNAFAEGLLTVSPEDYEGVYRPFALAEGEMKVDAQKMQQDIEKYGVYTYEEWSEYLTYEEFMAFNGMYFKVLVGKGIITEQDIFTLLQGFRENPDIQANGDKEQHV